MISAFGAVPFFPMAHSSIRTTIHAGDWAALPPTQWSVVAKAGKHDHPAYRTALDSLAQIYRPVLLRYLTGRMRLTPCRAEDLEQAFFLEKVLEQNILSQATPLKGRLRSFVLKVFSNYVTSQLRAMLALKRRPSSPNAPRIDDLPEMAAADNSPAESFDVLWSKQMIARATSRMREACRAEKRQVLWQIFEARILSPLLDGGEPMPYETLVAHFGLRSPSEASNLLITAKRMFVRTLRETVRETVSDEREVEAEIMELKRILSR